MNISKRLDKLVQTVIGCSVLADIGCDHGYVGISAVKCGKADHVIAADVAAGPLSAARLNAAAEGVSDSMSFVLSDGFSAIADTADIECAVIAGMGGILMRDILREGRLERFGSLRQLVLSPQSDIDLVRRYIVEELHGSIACEHVLFDESKYYFIFDVRLNDRSSPAAEGYDDGAYSEAEYYYGRNISADSAETYIDYLHFRQRISETARDAAAAGGSARGMSKAAELDRQLEYIQTILSRYALNCPAEGGKKEELKRHD